MVSFKNRICYYFIYIYFEWVFNFVACYLISANVYCLNCYMLVDIISIRIFAGWRLIQLRLKNSFVYYIWIAIFNIVSDNLYSKKIREKWGSIICILRDFKQKTMGNYILYLNCNVSMDLGHLIFRILSIFSKK